MKKLPAAVFAAVFAGVLSFLTIASNEEAAGTQHTLICPPWC